MHSVVFQSDKIHFKSHGLIFICENFLHCTIALKNTSNNCIREHICKFLIVCQNRILQKVYYFIYIAYKSIIQNINQLRVMEDYTNYNKLFSVADIYFSKNIINGHLYIWYVIRMQHRI